MIFLKELRLMRRQSAGLTAYISCMDVQLEHLRNILKQKESAGDKEGEAYIKGRIKSIECWQKEAQRVLKGEYI